MTDTRIDRENATVGQIMTANREEILRAWMETIKSTWGTDIAAQINEQHLISQAEGILDRLAPCCFTEDYDDMERPEYLDLVDALRKISASHAKQGIAPLKTALLVFSLKEVLLGFLKKAYDDDPATLNREVLGLNRLVDRMGLVTFDAYTKAREAVIAQQARTILELSTPTVKLWEKILLIPLIGVVDTQRAAQIIEGLLQTIFDTESQVAILDITGVPIIDTKVAQHLIKTIAAARMLGADVIVTGISPDTAQTMVKLDIDLGAVRTCGTLRAGVTEAFKLIGMKIVQG